MRLCFYFLFATFKQQRDIETDEVEWKIRKMKHFKSIYKEIFHSWIMFRVYNIKWPIICIYSNSIPFNFLCFGHLCYFGKSTCVCVWRKQKKNNLSKFKWFGWSKGVRYEWNQHNKPCECFRWISTGCTILLLPEALFNIIHTMTTIKMF